MRPWCHPMLTASCEGETRWYYHWDGLRTCVKLGLLGDGAGELYEQLIQFVVRYLGARLAACGMNPRGELKMVNFPRWLPHLLKSWPPEIMPERRDEPMGPSVLIFFFLICPLDFTNGPQKSCLGSSCRRCPSGGGPEEDCPWHC